MTTAIACNGIRADAPEYSSKAVLDLKWVIREVRKHYVLGSEELRGPRFNDDDAVLLRMRSGASEEAALLAPLSWAHAALADCANADYHYAFEKQWDDEPFGGEA